MWLAVPTYLFAFAWLGSPTLDIGCGQGPISGFEFTKFPGPVRGGLSGDTQCIRTAYWKIIFLFHTRWTAGWRRLPSRCNGYFVMKADLPTTLAQVKQA
jgi:hypothetical protein